MYDASGGVVLISRRENTMPDTQNLKVTAQDIASVSEKLYALKQQLSPGEQNVLQWLLGRAAQAPQEPTNVLKGGESAGGSSGSATSPRTAEFHKILGISQFPGAAGGGSSVGVTGTVMF
jgi:hypothetical protein